MSNLPLEYSLLEEKIGYKFKDKSLIKLALTHTSYVNEVRAHGTELESNERLEFLGDSVLSVIVSSYLYNNFEQFLEGDMTKVRAEIVCEKALAKYAEQISLGSFLFLGKGEDKNNGRHNKSITSDAFEAMLAAVWLDSEENLSVIEKIVLPFAKKEIEAIKSRGNVDDYKTRLQTLVQQSGETLEYAVVSESGPEHNKTFKVEARLNSNVIGTGEGGSKRKAEQNAAREALVLFGDEK